MLTTHPNAHVKTQKREKSDKKSNYYKKKYKKPRYKFGNPKISSTFATANHKGTLAEWLGNGLQNRVRRFESARYLKERDASYDASLFFCNTFPLKRNGAYIDHIVSTLHPINEG